MRRSTHGILSKGCSRRDFLKLTAAGMTAGSIGFPAIAGSSGGKRRKIVVLGMDGMDPQLLEMFLKQGRMPNAARLIKKGGFSRLISSDPPQSPVAWSNFISGTNPGGHGIYDFIARDPSTQVPYLSTSRTEVSSRTVRIAGYDIPLSGSKVINMRQGPTFWKDLQESGIDCTVLRIPSNYPPTSCGAKTLSGLGTPDVHGSYGIFTFYTDRAGELSRDVPGGRIERVSPRDHKVECILRGPVNAFDPEQKSADVRFKVFVDPTAAVALVSMQGRDFILKENEWSDWIQVSFAMLPHLVSSKGICRFYLKKVRDDFALYVSPVDIDPSDPALPISTPDRYSRSLSERLGRFYTQGIAEDTKALTAGVLSDDDYRHQAIFVMNENIRMFESEFNRFKDGFFFSYFSSLDLNSHMFWRTMDRSHPLYSPGLEKAHGDFIPWLYARMDAVIGRTIDSLDEDSLLMVMSDHGFNSFRRQFNLNSWLMDNGYANIARGASRGSSGYFGEVDWTRTRAYGLGINSLYLNLKGREPSGIVARGDEGDSLAVELAAGLKAIRDPKTGEQVISNVFRPSEIYSGHCVGSAPDLLVGYNRNYRASWDTVLGKYPKDLITDNTDPWSGDHAIDASLIPGVLLCNRTIKSLQPALLDLAPTILREFGVSPPAGMTGKPVL